MDKNKFVPIDNISFEEALNELKRITELINNSSENLEQVLVLFERGVALKNHCEKKLKNAKMRIEKVIADNSGNIEKKERVEL